MVFRLNFHLSDKRKIFLTVLYPRSEGKKRKKERKKDRLPCEFSILGHDGNHANEPDLDRIGRKDRRVRKKERQKRGIRDKE